MAASTASIWEMVLDGASAVSLSGGPEDGGDDEPFWAEEEGTVELVQLGANRAKNVLVLMSDTGGGHRASAEAIKDAFRIEFGDDYRVFVKDLCKDHAGWPFNNMENSYKFMVKHVQPWKVAFHGTSPDGSTTSTSPHSHHSTPSKGAHQPGPWHHVLNLELTVL